MHARTLSRIVWLTGCYASFVVCYSYFRLACHRFLDRFECLIMREAIQRYSLSMKYVIPPSTNAYAWTMASCR